MFTNNKQYTLSIDNNMLLIQVKIKINKIVKTNFNQNTNFNILL